jgi:GT2 family glycosyltransferase
MAEVPFVRVVVINFDGGDVTLRCLDALHATDWPAHRLEVVLVDNASVDGLVWTVRERYPWVRLVESLENEGFARGCNLGMGDLAGVDVVCLVNNDAVPEPGWLRPLVDALERDPHVGAASPKLVFLHPAVGVVVDAPVGVEVLQVELDGVDAWGRVRFDERWAPAAPGSRAGMGPAGDRLRRTARLQASLWSAVPDGSPVPTRLRLLLAADAPSRCRLRTGAADETVTVGPEPVSVELRVAPFDVINNAGSALYEGWFGGDRGFLEPDLGQYDEPTDVFAWCGGAVALKADYLREIGRFDPRFFLYYEDFELSWRGLERGWRYRYVPESRVRHAHAHSSGEWSPFFTFWVDRNRRLALVEHAPAGVAARVVLEKVAGTARFAVSETVQAVRQRRVPPVRKVLRRGRELGSLLESLPHGVRRRVAHRRRSLVADEEIRAWMVSK